MTIHEILGLVLCLSGMVIGLAAVMAILYKQNGIGEQPQTRKKQ